MAVHSRSDMELWDRPFQTMLVGVLGINVLAHFEYVPLWIFITSLTALLWKLGHLYFAWPQPRRFYLYAAGALSLCGIVWEYKTAFGHEAATPFLVFLASLKTLETNRDRDAMFIILTSYFLLMAHLLHSQSLASTFFMAFDVAIITILMFQLHRADRRLTSRSLRPIVKLLLLTIPIWTFLFIVFPRFSLNLNRTQQMAAATGFSEGIDPGAIANLAQSNETTFRVRFLSLGRRSPEDLYWRGATLYDGTELSWRPLGDKEIRFREGPLPKEAPWAKGSDREPLVEYEIMLEPSGNRSLFALPRIAKVQVNDRTARFRPLVTTDELLRTVHRVGDRISYTVLSAPEGEGPEETLSDDMRARSLNVNVENRLALKQLAISISEGTRNPYKAIARLDEWFSSNEFRYSLQLGEKVSHSVEEFLLVKRVGFCEHFAAASATLLRLMGHPARVVVGYQGGKWNEFSKNLLVRSKDAHAWVEVWMPSRRDIHKGRWQTYDPTAMIAPLRLRLGGEYFEVAEEHQTRNANIDDALSSISRNFWVRAGDRVNLVWDYAQQSWIQFLIDYDQSGQRDFLNRLFEAFGLRASPFILAILIALFVSVAFRIVFLWFTRTDNSRLLNEWGRLERELKRAGILKSIADGPLTLIHRLEATDTEDARKVADGIRAFIQFRYARVGRDGGGDSGSDNDLYSVIAEIRQARRHLRRQTRAT